MARYVQSSNSAPVFVSFMKKLTVNPDALVVSILDEHKVMPFKEVYVRILHDAGVSTLRSNRPVSK